ncbi:TPA: hypothetical protein VDA67_006060 [Burkholderia vietnamiensis]|nr:hypothetical protein [Burkholderia vietnamiensis]HEP6287577.1 hypothetical protein [Burkholderia vietnamiensis]HEP6310532.1 hypothetical protein [Burkholderia vietnamiensis]
MTVTTSEQDISYETDGATVDFPIPFYFIDGRDIVVDKIDANGNLVTLSPGTDFTVSGEGSQYGGTASMTAPIARGFTLHIYREVPVTQETKYQQNDPFPARATETALDKLTMICQQLAAGVVNAIRYPLSEFSRNGVLPPAGARAQMLLGFDANGNQEMVPRPASVGAGDMILDTFVAGVDYTPDVSTRLTLSRAPINGANCWVYFDATEQFDFVLDGAAVQFSSPIPSGVTAVRVRSGTTLSVGTTAQRSVGDPQLTWGNVLNRTVDSIAALRTLDTSVYSRAFVTGYYAPHDGGGGAYQLDLSDNVSADNGGTIIMSADGGRWKLQYAGSVSVIQFGAKGDGAADDTARIQAAINSGVKDIYFAQPSSFYKLTAPLTVTSDGIFLRGPAQSQSAGIKQTTNNVGIISNTGSGNRFENLTLDYATTPISGATAFYSAGFGTRVSSLTIKQAYVGIEVTGQSTQFFDNFYVYGYVSIGVFVHAVNDIYFNKFIINAGSASGTFGGIRLQDKAEAIIFTDGDVLLGAYSMTTDASSYTLNNRPAYCNFTNVFFDSALQGTSLNNIVESEFVGCWFSGGRSGGGFAGCTLVTTDSISFVSTRFFNCGASGCSIGSGAVRTTFTACKAESNSFTAGAGIASGLSFAAGTTDFSVIGGKAHNGLYPGQQGYGITINSGCDRFVIKGVQVGGNSAGGINDLSLPSAKKTISGNVGFITANTGSAILASGGTAVVVTHGLGGTPAASNIQITPTVSTGSNPIYVDTTSITSTTFTVRCASAAPSNYTFSWRATCNGQQ